MLGFVFVQARIESRVSSRQFSDFTSPNLQHQLQGLLYVFYNQQRNQPCERPPPRTHPERQGAGSPLHSPALTHTSFSFQSLPLPRTPAERRGRARGPPPLSPPRSLSFTTNLSTPAPPAEPGRQRASRARARSGAFLPGVPLPTHPRRGACPTCVSCASSPWRRRRRPARVGRARLTETGPARNREEGQRRSAAPPGELEVRPAAQQPAQAQRPAGGGIPVAGAAFRSAPVSGAGSRFPS